MGTVNPKSKEKQKMTASGAKRTKQPQDKKTGGKQKVERPVSAIGMAISPALLEKNFEQIVGSTNRTAKRGIPSNDVAKKRAVQRKIAERAVSGAASRGAVSEQRTKPTYPQPIASGVKRGRKRNVVVEQRGWGIYNKKTSYLIDEFFKRKTDAISHLERDQKQPWSAIKHQDELKPVPIKIIIMDKEIMGLAKAQKSGR